MPMSMLETFICERQYIMNVSARTVDWYRQSFQRFAGIGLETPNAQPYAELVRRIKNRVTELAASGRVKPISINTWLRPVNAYLRWCVEEGHVSDCTLDHAGRLPKRMKVAKLKEPKTVIQPLRPAEIKAIVEYKPRTKGEKRIHTIALMILDTGTRIDEVLSLRREDVDLENMLITINGKGAKQRIVPISPVGRKLLYRWLQTHESDLVFPDRRGCKLRQRNLLRDYKVLAQNAGVSNPRAWHQLRHSFALAFIASGGDVFSLQRILGHATLDMTRRYVNQRTEDIQRSHTKHARLLVGAAVK